MNELVSIVMPVYNAEKYLDEAIQSCFNQTVSNFELIVGNDGSTDGSAEILNSYSDRLKIIFQENKGVSGACNAGIKKIKGKWYKVMNADDVLYPECLELLLFEIKKLNNKKIIVQGKMDIMDEKGKIIREWQSLYMNHLSNFEQNVRMLERNQVIHITSIFHKDIFANYGYYNESIKAAVDYELWLRLCLLHEFRFHLLDKKVAKLRFHDERLTGRATKENQDYAEDARRIVLKKLNAQKQKEYENAVKIYKRNLERDLINYKKSHKLPLRSRTKRKIIHLKNKVFF